MFACFDNEEVGSGTKQGQALRSSLMFSGELIRRLERMRRIFIVRWQEAFCLAVIMPTRCIPTTRIRQMLQIASI